MHTTHHSSFSHHRLLESIAQTDPQLAAAIKNEEHRQQHSIELIASENLVSPAVLAAAGSILTNKYAEGYPGRRYYGGCEAVDQVERLAIERAKLLFGAGFANVQPHSGSQANQTVFMAILQPGDTILSMSLDCGGHLTHGHRANQSGKWFKTHHYGVDKNSGLVDYDEVRRAALTHRPKLLIAGASAYSRRLDFAKFRTIAYEVGAYLLADVAHYAGLIATGHYPNPMPHAHFVTSTTHKTLRGPRGGLVMTNDSDLAKKIDSALFPGIQGGPLMHIIAAKAVAFHEALQPDFADYIARVIASAQQLAAVLMARGYPVISGGTDSHLLIVDLRGTGISGAAAEKALDAVGITCNKNTVPYDPAGPTVTSGIRLGTPAIVSRGFDMAAVTLVGQLIADLLDDLRAELMTVDSTGSDSAAHRAVDAVVSAIEAAGVTNAAVSLAATTTGIMTPANADIAAMRHQIDDMPGKSAAASGIDHRQHSERREKIQLEVAKLCAAFPIDKFIGAI